MPSARITVASVTDEGDQVIVRGTLGDTSTAMTFVFRTKGDRIEPALADRASRLGAGVVVSVDYAVVAEGWNVALGLSDG
jgi:thiamine monophosphate kinase